MTPPDPGAVLAIWSAGLAAGGAVVAAWKVARPGYIRLVGAVIAGLGLLAGFAGGGWLAWFAAAVSAWAAVRREGSFVAPALGVATGAFLVAAGNSVGWMSALVGSASLGGITSEMLLGHWFLVDPKLPRWPLRRLAIAGVVGAAAEGSVVALQNGPELLASRTLLAALAGFAALLMVAVVFSLRVKSYTGVMAATGLSYLATLLALAVAIVARPVPI